MLFGRATMNVKPRCCMALSHPATCCYRKCRILTNSNHIVVRLSEIAFDRLLARVVEISKNCRDVGTEQEKSLQ